MSRYVGNFMFHPVGHGLFYSGTIKNLSTDKQVSDKQYSFVYDCGGKNKTIIDDAIKGAKLPSKIDLLIISHFHKDHINGVLKLIEKHEVKTVILPYLDAKSKVLYIAELKEEKSEDEAELTAFIQDPQDFLKQHSKQHSVKEVFFIKEGKYHQPKRNDGDQNGRGNNNESFKSFSWDCEIIKENDKKIIIGNGNYFSPIWVFNFFMPKRDEAKFKGINLEGIVDSNTDEVNWKNIDENKWNEIQNQMKPLRNNASNLVCAHGPTDNVFVQKICNNKFIPSEQFKRCLECDFLCHYHYCHWHEGNIGFQFLTGDAEIDDQDAFLTNYQSDLKKSILFQVPHHGSDENWKDWFSEYQPFCYLWPVTHNADHKYGLPSAKFSYIAPYSVTEYETTRLGIQIHFVC
ncbi:MBL fold metallo-hydrolase [bacterium]|nr:MBL fold metallo-hydrolase [bacterium]